MLDTLLSMSALPLLFTSYNSWSTSLNLLFFYITWSTLLLSHPPIKIELIGSLIIRVLCFWLPALLFLLFDVGIPSLAKNIKLQGVRGLGQGRGGAKAIHRAKVIGWALLNTVLAVAVQGAIEFFFTEVLGKKSALKISSKLPLPGELLWGVFRGIVLREISQFYIHRFVLHDESGFLARAHQTWQHSIAAPWSVVAQYDHPVAHVVGRALPTYLPAVLFRFHLLTWFLFLAVVSVEEVTTFSGYSTVYSMLGGATKRTDKHFEANGEGNFAPWGLLDWMHGTTVGPDIAEDAEDAIDEHEERKRRRLQKKHE
ncbi:sterol desaturase [Sphaerosporella brunnea]|uniref:Sterol desaturase n=1 Tax=Sphaerosporella brunnea TaxID=1250544 RepID=A0A5J5F6Y6_9PEZI|nr:sterol desaturase [Sphaerosporella brunnea]